MTEVLMEEGINDVAVTYTNNDYGKGLADSFQAAFEAAGGTVTINAAHEDGKADYSAEVGALAAAGGDRLVVAGYVDQGGSGIVRAAIAMAEGLDVDIAAEGVETQDQLAFLRESRCGGAQGYYISRPMDAEKVNKLLHTESLGGRLLESVSAA